jgi:rubredoxin
MHCKITEEKGKFKVFFNKKQGFKFKKSFPSSDGVSLRIRIKTIEYFIEECLRFCCLACKQNGWVYKTQLPKPLRSSLKGGGKGLPPISTLTTCPECKMEHRVQHEDEPIPQPDGSIFMSSRVVLTLASTDKETSAQQDATPAQPMGKFSLHVEP